MTKALELTQICKAYQVVKKGQAQPATRSARLQGVMQFLLGETFGALRNRHITTIPALDNVSFTVEPGQIVGLFGKNGSGKTTLLSILGGIFPADSGAISCFDHDLATELHEVRKYVVPIFGWLDAITWAFTGRQNIEKFLLMHHVEPRPLTKEIEDLAQAIALDDRLDDRAARYSQGMRIKLQVIAAILLQRAYGRSLLLLDEPFIGLDLISQRYLRHFVGQELQRDNFSMLLATHQPEDIELLCDEVILLDHGQVIAKDSVANLRRMVCKTESIQLIYEPASGNEAPAIPTRAEIQQHQTLARNGLLESTLIVEDSSATLAWLIPRLLQANCRLVSVQTQPMTFGDVLLALIADSDHE